MLVVVAGVLRASITVMQQALRVRSPRFDGVTQRGADQWCGEAFRDRPAHDFSTEQVPYDGQIHPAELGWQVGNIGDPLLIGSVRVEILIQDVGCRNL